MGDRLGTPEVGYIKIELPTRMEISPTTNGDEEGISGAQWQQAPMDGWYQVTRNDKADSLGSSGSMTLDRY